MSASMTQKMTSLPLNLERKLIGFEISLPDTYATEAFALPSLIGYGITYRSLSTLTRDSGISRSAQIDCGPVKLVDSTDAAPCPLSGKFSA